jgi:general secretion pathway protein H
MRMWAAGSDMSASLPRCAWFAAPNGDASALRRLGCWKTSATQAYGFTLLELLVVISIIAIGAAGVSFAFRDSASTALDREADRLAAVLEAVRAQSRSSGVAMVWLPLPNGYVILPAEQLALSSPQDIASQSISPWLAEGTSAQVIKAAASTARTNPAAQSLQLGPEPMLAAQAVVLSLGERQLRLSTDGLRPFRVNASADTDANPAPLP